MEYSYFETPSTFTVMFSAHPGLRKLIFAGTSKSDRDLGE